MTHDAPLVTDEDRRTGRVRGDHNKDRDGAECPFCRKPRMVPNCCEHCDLGCGDACQRYTCTIEHCPCCTPCEPFHLNPVGS